VNGPSAELRVLDLVELAAQCGFFHSLSASPPKFLCVNIVILRFLLCGVLLVQSASQLVAQDTVNPRALPDSLSPGQFVDSQRARDIARALASYLCTDSVASPRVIPYVPDINSTPEERPPDIAPGILGAFFTGVAQSCTATVPPRGQRRNVQFIGLRAPAVGDSAYVFWQVTFPTVNGRFSIELMLAVATQHQSSWRIASVQVIRRDHYEIP
jgi:hypothetical protein